MAERATPLDARERAAVLERTSPFSALPPAHISELAAASKCVVLSKGEALWRAHDRAHHLGVVLVGRLKLRRPQRSREVIVDVAGPGDVLGEVAFSMSASYQSDAVCLRRARVLLVPALALRRILESSPRAALALALDLAAQNVRLLRALEDVSLGTVEQRLARVLLRLAERVGEPFPGGTLIPMKLRRADLASIAATTLESTSRKISEWHRRGWVVPQPAGYLIRDPRALREVADAV